MLKKIINFININKTTLLICLILLVLGYFTGKKIFSKPKSDLIQLSSVQTRDILVTVSASGKVKADEEVTLRFQTAGQLAWVGVKEGDRVKKWQAIAALDKNELQKTLNQELIDYMSKRWDYEQTNLDTYRDQALTETIRRVKEKSQLDLDRSVLDVEIQDIALKYATLISPIDGIVTEIEAPFPGVNVTALYGKFVIANPNSLIFSANVDEAEIGKVQVGQIAKITFDAYPNEPQYLPIDHIEFTPTLTSGGGTAYAAQFKLPPNNEEKYKLEMNGDVEILTAAKNQVLTISQTALRENKDEKYVWLWRNNTAVKKVVETGLNDDSYLEVTKGLNENDQILISGFKNFEKNNGSPK